MLLCHKTKGRELKLKIISRNQRRQDVIFVTEAKIENVSKPALPEKRTFAKNIWKSYVFNAGVHKLNSSQQFSTYWYSVYCCVIGFIVCQFMHFLLSCVTQRSKLEYTLLIIFPKLLKLHVSKLRFFPPPMVPQIRRHKSLLSYIFVFCVFFAL